jgi:hypothetical protein
MNVDYYFFRFILEVIYKGFLLEREKFLNISKQFVQDISSDGVEIHFNNSHVYTQIDELLYNHEKDYRVLNKEELDSIAIEILRNFKIFVDDYLKRDEKRKRESHEFEKYYFENELFLNESIIREFKLDKVINNKLGLRGKLVMNMNALLGGAAQTNDITYDWHKIIEYFKKQISNSSTIQQ